MEMDEKAYDGVVVLSVTGSLEVDHKEEFRTKINDLVNRGNVHVVLDLSRCPYMDAVGLGDIVRAYTTLSRKDGRMVLLSPSKRIHNLMSITKLLTVFEMFDNEDEAVRALKATRNE